MLAKKDIFYAMIVNVKNFVRTRKLEISNLRSGKGECILKRKRGGEKAGEILRRFPSPSFRNAREGTIKA